MSDEAPPTGPAPEPPEHAPHGVVETLREEIEEVVEHVPEPVRWTLGKIVRLALLSLVALVVLAIVSTVLYLGNRTQLVAHELALIVNQALREHSDVELQLDDIKGNPFSGIRIVNPRIRYRDGGGTVLEADEMTAAYSVIGLLRGHHDPIVVTVVRPVVRLNRGAKGAWRVPTWNGGKPRPGGASRAFDFALHLRDAQLYAPEPVGGVQDIDLDASGVTGNGTQVDLSRLRWRQGPWSSHLIQLAAAVRTDADSVRLTIRELRTDDLTLRATSAWKQGTRFKVVHAEVDRVRWGWLAEVFDNDSFDVDGEGAAVVDASGDSRWHGKFATHVSWDSLAVQGAGLFAWDGRQLALDSLAGHSRAGDLHGQLRWSKQGWMLGGLADHANPAFWSALRLEGWPAGDLNGKFLYTVDTRSKPSSRLDADLLASNWTGWQVDSARVRVDFPAVASDSFHVRGWRRGGAFVLHAGVNKTGWTGTYALDRFPLEEWPDGRASGLSGLLDHGEGGIEQRSGTLRVSGTLSGSRLDWSAAHFARWRLDDVDGQLLPKPDLTANVRLLDGFFVGIHLDSLASGLHLGDQVASFSALHAAAGDTLFKLEGDATWVGATWNVVMSAASAASAQFAWVAEPPLRLSGDAQGTLFDRVVANDQHAHLEARGRWASPGGRYDFEMTGHALDLSRLGMPRDLGLAGTADAHLVVHGRSGDPSWTFDAGASHPAFGGHACDSLATTLAGEPHQLEIRQLAYRLHGGELDVDGKVDQAPNAFPDSLSATAVLRWLENAGHWQGHVRAHGLPIDGLGAIAAQAAGWSGRLDGQLDVAGSPPKPQLDLALTASDLGYRDYRAQRVETQAHYRDGTLQVPELHITMQNVVSTVSGHLPVTLALGRNPIVPDAPMAWQFQVPKGDLQLLPLLVPQIQSARGRFDLAATVAGTTRHPKLTGAGHLLDGVLRPAGREEVLEGVNASFEFDESHVRLDSLTAKQGRAGRITGNGTAELSGFEIKHYHFKLGMRDFAASQEGLYAMLFDGDFDVVDGQMVGGQRLPQVTGDVRLTRGVVEFDFANQTEVEKRLATTEPLFWTYKIHMEAPSNLRWRPPDGDMEFNADLDLEQTPDSLLIYGEMHIIKGYYYFLSNRFNVTQADLTFDNQRGLDPQLDIIADTNLRPSQADTHGAPVTEDVTAHITGRSSKPVIDLSSPDWDQKQILGELTYGRFTNAAGNVSLTDPLDSYLTRQLNNQLSQDLSKFFNDSISQWEVARTNGGLLGGNGDVYVTIGGAGSHKISWQVRQRLPGLDRPDLTTATTSTPFERDVELDYRLNRFIYVTTGLSQPRILTGATQTAKGSPDFNLNLKARWEY